MPKLIYATNMSVDGWTEDATGRFDWAPPDDEVFAFTTDLMRVPGTYLYGRRLYEVMAVWETDPTLAAGSDLARAFATTWQAADKVVYSTTLTEPVTARTRIERSFDAAVFRATKEQASQDLLIGGPNLASQALAAGLVDECRLLVWPVVLAGRNAALQVGALTSFALLDQHRFANGVMYLRYGTV